MKRTLKTLSILLLVSSVSFVFAQEKEADDDRRGGGGKSVIKDNVKKGDGVKLDGTAKTKDSGPAPARLSSHETGVAAVDKAEGKGKAKKGSFWQRIFGKKKVKKEEDPN